MFPQFAPKKLSWRTIDAELTSKTGKGQEAYLRALAAGHTARELVMVATYDETTPEVLPAYLALPHAEAARLIAEIEHRGFPQQSIDVLARERLAEFTKLGAIGLTPAVVVIADAYGSTVTMAEGIAKCDDPPGTQSRPS